MIGGGDAIFFLSGGTSAQLFTNPLTALPLAFTLDFTANTKVHAHAHGIPPVSSGYTWYYHSNSLNGRRAPSPTS